MADAEDLNNAAFYRDPLEFLDFLGPIEEVEDEEDADGDFDSFTESD